MSERDFGSLATKMRSTGSVRFLSYDLEPRSPMNTGSLNLVHQILWSVLSEDPEKFREDNRPERAEVRYHWKDLTDSDKEKILQMCSQRIETNEIIRERGWQELVFNEIYRSLNIQVT